MASSYIPIGGLWERKTSRGPVLSCQVNPAIRQKLLAALAVDEMYELTIFVNDRRDKPNSPTHNLVLSVSGARPAAPAPSDVERSVNAPGAQPATGKGHPGVMGEDFIRNPAPKRELDADDIPFAWLLPFVLPALLFGSYI